MAFQSAVTREHSTASTRSPLHDFPLEILLLVVNDLPPRDLLSFGQTCKYHWTICVTMIEEHRDMYQKHQLFILDTDKHDNHAWEYLDLLIENPRICGYVEAVVLWERQLCYRTRYGPNPEDLVEDPGDDSPPKIKKSDLKRWFDSIFDRNFFPYLYPHDGELELSIADVATRLFEGSEHFILGHVLTMLPNLKYLELMLDIADDGLLDYFNAASHKIFIHDSAEGGDDKQVGISNLALEAEWFCPWPFTELQHVKLIPYDPGVPTYSSWLHAFSKLPSMRIFQAHGLGTVFPIQNSIVDVALALQAPIENVSNLTELILTQTSIDIEDLVRLLQRMLFLEVLFYEDCVLTDFSEDTQRIKAAASSLAVLAESAGHSLRNLWFRKLHVFEVEKSTVESKEVLRELVSMQHEYDFPKLTLYSSDFHIFAAAVHMKIKILLDGLKTLILWRCPNDLHFAIGLMDLVPNLRAIYLTTITEDTELERKMIEQAQRRGVLWLGGEGYKCLRHNISRGWHPETDYEDVDDSEPEWSSSEDEGSLASDQEP